MWMAGELKIGVDIAGVVMETALLAYFLHMLLGPIRVRWYEAVAVYLLLTLGAWLVVYLVKWPILRMMCCLALTVGLAAICYHGKVWNKFFVGAAFVLMGCLVEYGVHGLLNLLAGEVYAAGMHDMQDYILGISISNLLKLLLAQLLLSYIKHSRKHWGQLSAANLGLLLIFPVTTLGALYIVYYAFLQKDDLLGVALQMILTVLLLAANFCVFLLFNRLLEADYAEKQHARARQQLISQEKHYQAMAEKGQALRCWSHETRNALLAIAGFIQNGQLDEALTQIELIEGNLSAFVPEISGNIALDTVLESKQQRAREMGVSLRYTVAVYEAIAVDVMELVVIIANGLDNALEAVAKLAEPEGSVITCALTLQQNWLKIVIVNPVAHQVAIQGEVLPTDKSDPLRHGIGLTNVRSIVESHQGSLELSCKGEQFIFQALLENR